MNYTEAEAWILNQLPMFQRKGDQAFKKDLHNIRRICEALGNPQNRFPSIHIAGTNGKGSSCHMLASILMEAGYKTGLATSPHFLDFRERIRVNGLMCPKEFIVEFVEKHSNLLKTLNASFFEAAIGISFQYFSEEKVDIAVVETGLGGRLDATNILHPILSLITNIGMDHMSLLGDTPEKIAAEKAGIIKAGVPVIVGESSPETLPVFMEKAKSLHSPLLLAEDFPFPDYDLDLKGEYQRKNSRSVILAVEELRKLGFDLPEEAVKAGLLNVKKNTGLRGRWEKLGENPLIIADTAHNAHGLKEIQKQLEHTSYSKLHLVLGFVSDKDVPAMLSFFPSDAIYYFSQPDIPRKLPLSQLKEIVPPELNARFFESVREAFTAAREAAEKEDMIYVGGSSFVVAEIL